ncbi:hypothetical protein KFK09_000543 [Dendrobium nobile]|uniref:Uncharacterized protein n=1 Tax=Dendrobium nobile TaxID=94219 RepID=A0A8T3C8V4_DENNO|nr:hypothetical protein KFK09_000543 [Dendrobium nobile]
MFNLQYHSKKTFFRHEVPPLPKEDVLPPSPKTDVPPLTTIDIPPPQVYKGYMQSRISNACLKSSSVLKNDHPLVFPPPKVSYMLEITAFVLGIPLREFNILTSSNFLCKKSEREPDGADPIICPRLRVVLNESPSPRFLPVGSEVTPPSRSSVGSEGTKRTGACSLRR